MCHKVVHNLIRFLDPKKKKKKSGAIKNMYQNLVIVVFFFVLFWEMWGIIHLWEIFFNFRLIAFLSGVINYCLSQKLEF